jgi:hypothetical protein
MKKLLVAICAFTIACASTAPETSVPVVPAQTQSANAYLSQYEGTYALQGPNRVINLRVWVDAEGKLNGELVGLGQQTTFRASAEPNRFLHANADDIWVLFAVENGRATSATMHQRGREINGPRTQ